MILARRSSVPLMSRADDRGSARTDRLAPGVVLSTLTGRIPAGWVDAIVQATELELIEGPRLNLFVDAVELEGIPKSFVPRAVEMFLPHRRRLASLSALGTSRVLQTAVSVANLSLGGIVALYNDRGSFETAIEAALLKGPRRR